MSYEVIPIIVVLSTMHSYYIIDYILCAVLYRPSTTL